MNDSIRRKERTSLGSVVAYGDDKVEAKTRFALENYSRYRDHFETAALPDLNKTDFDERNYY